MINIKLNNNEYPIPESALVAPKAAFVSHLGTIAGNDLKITIDGVEYGVDASKLADAVSAFEDALNDLSGSAGEERLEGDGAEYYTLAPTTLSFRSTAPLNELQEVQINGVTVDPSNYTLEEGSTIVTFSIDYLKTLNVGSYEVNVVSDSKAVKGDFTVAAPEPNEYEFYYNVPYVGRIEYFGDIFVLVFKHTGEANIITINTPFTEACVWSMQTSNTLRISSSMGEFDLTIEGCEQMSCATLGSVFEVDLSVCAADKDWLYINYFQGWTVMPLDRHKQQYLPIKSHINDNEVCRLYDQSFYESSEITQVPELPSTLQFIGNGAFEDCINLASLTLPKPNGHLEIGGYAFANTALSEIYIPSPLNETDKVDVRNRAFSDCKNLCRVTIGERVSLYEAVFADCVNLTTIIYEGTTARWSAFLKSNDWNYGCPATYVQCSDGQVAL